MTLDASRWARVTELFDTACQQPSDTRDAWVETHGDDAELRAEVRAMLQAYESDPDFLEGATGVAAALDEAAADGLAGRRLGAYRLVRQIGRGGQGVVYEAQRDDQEFDRRTAIKILPIWNAPAFAERFRFERRVLAGLDHPGIARLLDAGTTSDGITYFVMEYVEGQPVTQWCNARALTLRDRVALVTRICDAVAYAHQHLVVHRDLKPANIFIDAQGQPKLLDFGIAAILSEESGVSAGLTRTGHHSFTPEYASPEQLRGEQVSTASDVYSLGVLLYLLLAGRHPYALQGLSPLEVMRTVCEVDPPMPSSVAPVGMRAALKGDLDAVIGKALRKAPGERYRTVAELAADLRAWQNGRPVVAAPATFGYRAKRFITRNKTAVGAAAALTLALVGGGATTAWQARVAQEERDKAQNRFRQVEEFSRSLLFDVNEALARVPGSTEPRRLLLDRAVQFLDGLAGDADNDAAMKLELAEGYRRLGGIQGGTEGANIGDRRAAAESFGKATRLADEVVSARPNDIDALVVAMNAQFDRLTVARRIGDAAEAAAGVERHRALLTALERVTPRDGRIVAAIASGYADVATNSEGRAEYPDAEKALMTALALYEQLPASARTSAVRERHAYVLKRLGAVLQWMKRFDESERRYRQALALDEQALAENPGDPSAQYALTVTLSNLGGVLFFLERPAESVAPWTRALEIRRAMVAADPKDLRAVEGLATLLSRFSSLAYREKRFADSAAYNREKVTLFSDMAEREGPIPRTVSQRALSRLELAMALVAQADADASTRRAVLAEAREALRQAPLSDYTYNVAFAGVPISTFRQIRADLTRRLGMHDEAARP